MKVCQIINWIWALWKKTKYGPFFCAGKMIFIIACSFCLFCLSSLPDEGFTLPNWPARRGEAKFSDTSKYSALSWAWICKLDQTIHYLIECKTLTAQCNLGEWLKMYCHFNNSNCRLFWRQKGISRNVAKLFKRHHSIPRSLNCFLALKGLRSTLKAWLLDIFPLIFLKPLNSSTKRRLF